MDKDIEKVKQREKERWDRIADQTHGGEDEPFNDAIDFLGNVEGYPTGKKPVDMKRLPKPIRLIGYILMGITVVAILVFLVLFIVM